MENYLKALNLELTKYVKLVKEIPKMNIKEMITKKNLLVYKANILKEVQSAIKTVDWSDKFIIGVLVFHSVILSSILSSRCSCKQVLTIVALAILSLSANYLNTLGMNNWEKFATKNYFDKDGSFMLLFINIPVLIEVILSLFMLMCTSCCGKCKCKGNCCRSKVQKGKKTTEKKTEPKAKPAPTKKSKINKKKNN